MKGSSATAVVFIVKLSPGLAFLLMVKIPFSSTLAILPPLKTVHT
jgi:hypothetical protein